jgi:phytoene dehydrogenase-like protein
MGLDGGGNWRPTAPTTIKDSGIRQEFASGMVRDTQLGKIEFDRTLDGPMFERWAQHLTTAARDKYHDIAPGVPNWTVANSPEEWARFKKSALRHMLQWFRGDVDEDHAAAVFFNINGAEYVKGRQG